MIPTEQVLRNLWIGAGLPIEYLQQAEVSLLNADEHVLKSSYRIGVAAQASIAASALADSLYRHLVDGSPISVEGEARHAALEFASERMSRIRRSNQPKEDAVPVSDPAFKTMIGLPPEALVDWDPLAGYYECAQDRYIRLHTNFKHHRNGLLKILGLPEDASREQVAEVLLEWDAEHFEDSARESGMCATMCRTAEEWKATPAAQSVQAWLDDNGGCPVKVTRVKMAKSKKEEVSPKRSMRVLDMSRVIAAPVAGRTLAKYGADVLLISCLRLPNLPMFEIDTTRGKRAAEVDLDHEEGMATMKQLIQNYDVLLQAYRPGALANRSLSLDDVQKLRPGLIYAELSAYGFTGPWKDVRGFDSLVQSASGINSSEAESYRRYASATGLEEQFIEPRVLPCQALDHASGYLLAFGIMAARCRSLLDPREEQTDGWHVQVSLAGTAAWLESLGKVVGAQAWEVPKAIEASSEEVNNLLEEYTVRGSSEPLTLHSIKHAARPLPPHSRTVPIRIGIDAPKWKSLI